ncbi:hypothetical protein ACD661_05285 [Legionella lytica]|uniref:Dot/Icm T4SS effector n=1 Tax=Legionella lytica TaxID=96232 RepID=A0ABW8D5J7_9GAMM
MSFPKFYVTYGVMDTDAGASPLGHSLLLFSKQNQKDSPVEVVDSIGFYSQPSTTKDPIIKSLKSFLGFNIDLQDGHGVLQQELQRYLNGKGLRGISFLVNETQFTLLQNNYKERMREEQEAIAELNAELSAKGSPANGYTRYLAEKERAQAEQRSPRLHPFHVTMKTTLKGFNSSASYTCKNRALDFLSDAGIIDVALRKELEGGHAQQAFPRFHDLALPPIPLVTTGEPEEHHSSKGQIFHNPTWAKNRLFWATTPEEPGKTGTQDYRKLRATLDKIAKTTSELYQMIDRPERLNENELHQLKFQLKQVQKLSCLFIKPQLNHGATLQEHVLKAEKVLHAANLTLEHHHINASFLLSVYASLKAPHSIVGLLTMLLSAAIFFVAPTAGLALGALSGIATGLSLYGFYKDKNQGVNDSETDEVFDLSDLMLNNNSVF